MYHFIKKWVKFVVPKTVLKLLEPKFRQIVFLFYKGNKFYCRLCNARLKSFISLANKDLLCPRCGSLPRTRKLYDILEKKQLLKGKIVHFSPPLSFSKKLKQHPDIQYISSDFTKEFKADQGYDLTNINVPDHTFDLFLAYHVLEHILDDKQAMRELYRITKIGGKGLVQTPFKEGAIYEDVSIKTPEERLIYFGQADHVRIYSVASLKKRLAEVGFTVEVLFFEEAVDNQNGFKPEECVIIVSK